MSQAKSTDINLRQQDTYWQQKLNREVSTLQLPFDYSRPVVSSYIRETESIQLKNELYLQLKQFSAKKNVSLFALLLASLKILLLRYKNEDVIVGSLSADSLNNEENFVNLIALRTILNSAQTIEDVIKKVIQTIEEASANKDYPFEELIANIKENKGFEDRIFSVMFVCLSCPCELSQTPITEQMLDDVSQYMVECDLVFLASEEDKTLTINCEYDGELFEPESIQRILGHYLTLLEGMVNNPYATPVCQLTLLTEAEKRQILIDWNDTQAEYPKDKCIHQLFEEQVIKTPDNIAVVFEGQQLTYKQLNQKANQLAHYLQKIGVKAETLVGICCDRSFDMIIGLLGILKAGGAYVPLDPNYPVERLQYILEDSKISILLTQERLVNKLQFNFEKILKLDTDFELINQESKDNIPNEVSPHNLAYIIYTSGSTGKPKGVLIKHQGVSNLIHNQQKHFRLDLKSKVLQFFSLSFDGAVWEIFPTLASGSTLYLISQETQLNPFELNKFILNHQINIIMLPPSVLGMLPNNELPHLKTIGVGGEVCPANLINKLNQNQRSFLNAYGPTEVTVYATISHITDENNVNIGRPLDNVKIYILDSNLQPLPVGVSGEMYIGGDGLARGYLNKPELTAKKFVPNPFAEGKLYKTGDLAKYLSDGNIEFIGRIDDQVKIRGFRIELGEIETTLTQHPQIQEAVVLVKENQDKNKYLIAYLILKDKGLQNETIKSFLRKKLPDYMIPSVFIFLDKFPLNSNSKIDRKALLLLKNQKPIETTYVKPESDLEKNIVEIWQQVLKVSTIGIHDNFFDLGGNSLLMARVSSELSEQFSHNLSILELLQYPTINSLANYLSQQNNIEFTESKISNRTKMRREGKAKMKSLRKQRRK